MLVVTRRVSEGLTIGTTIRVVVVDIIGGKVRVGIDAPATIPVHRKNREATRRRKKDGQE